MARKKEEARLAELQRASRAAAANIAQRLSWADNVAQLCIDGSCPFCPLLPKEPGAHLLRAVCPPHVHVLWGACCTQLLTPHSQDLAAHWVSLHEASEYASEQRIRGSAVEILHFWIVIMIEP